MKVSEKSLELNVGAEILGLLRVRPGLRKAYLRGLTQAEERAEGVDLFAQLDPGARLFAFQFKAPLGRLEGSPYRYRLVDYQHRALHALAQHSAGSVYYVLPFYVTPRKLQQDVPNLLQDTWFLSAQQMTPPAVFGHYRTRTMTCSAGVASINPDYEMSKLEGLHLLKDSGLSPELVASWYAEFRRRGVLARSGRRSPWMSRGLRLLISVPENSS